MSSIRDMLAFCFAKPTHEILQKTACAPPPCNDDIDSDALGSIQVNKPGNDQGICCPQFECSHIPTDPHRGPGQLADSAATRYQDKSY